MFHLGSTHSPQQTLKTLYSAQLNIQALALQIAQTSIWDCQEASNDSLFMWVWLISTNNFTE